MFEIKLHYILEILVLITLTIYFIKKSKPKLIYLFLGYFFFILNVIFQFPFRYILKLILPYFTQSAIPIIAITIILVIISQLTKYFSLKRFLKTKSYKNGILFGIGWSSLESTSIIIIALFTYLFNTLGISFDYSYALAKELPLISFIFFFITNIATTIFVIMAIIKDKKMYILLAVLFQLLIFFISNYITSTTRIILLSIIFLISTTIIVHYRKL